MLTSLATSKAVSQGEALMLKFCPCFVCISFMKMRKWFRILKSTKVSFYSLRTFIGTCWASNADFRIPNQRTFIFTSQTDITEQKQWKKEKQSLQCFSLLFVLLIYLFLNISLNLPASFTCRVIPDSAWRLLQILFMIWNNNCSRSTLSYLLRDFCSHLHWFLCLSIRPKPPRLLPSSPGIFPLSPNPIQSSFTWIFASAPFLFHLSQP